MLNFSQLLYSALLENSSNYSHLCTLLFSVYAKKKLNSLESMQLQLCSSQNHTAAV